MSARLLLLLLALALAGCGGGGGLAEGGSAREEAAATSGVAVTVELPQDRADDAPARTVQPADAPARTVQPADAPARVQRALVVDLLDRDLRPAVPTRTVELDFAGGSQVVSLVPVPSGRYVLRVVAVDLERRLVAGWAEPVEVRPRELTRVLAALAPMDPPAAPLRIYAANRGDGSLSTLLDLGALDLQVLPRTSTGGQPRSLAADDRFLFVAQAGGLLRSFRLGLDLSAAGSVDAGTLTSALQVRGSRAYVALPLAGRVEGYGFDPATGALSGPAATSVPVPGPTDLLLHPTLPRGWVTASGPDGLLPLALSPSGDLSTPLPGVPLPGQPTRMALAAGHLYTAVLGPPRIVAHDVDPGTGALSNPRAVPVPSGAPTVLAAGPARLYAASPEGLAVFARDPATGDLSDPRRVDLPGATAVEAVRMDPDGRSLFVALSRGDAPGLLVVFDLDPGTGMPRPRTAAPLGVDPADLLLVR